MKIETKLRDLYRPIQPTVRQTADTVIYTEFLPDVNLRNFIYCYWQLHTKTPLSEQFNYRVVSDGCIDIYFELNNPYENYVMGFCEKFTEFPLENMFNYVGVRFLPTMFPQIFKVSAAELSNRYEHLSLVVPHFSEFISNCFYDTLKQEEIKVLFDEYFIKQLAKNEFNNDPRLYKSLEFILKNNGMLEVEKDLDMGISARQLRRIFEFYIGDTAKTFSKVVRFQNLLRAKPSTQSLQHDKLFFDLGYYDQSHFIKEFKNFFGTTPGKAFDQ